MSGFQGRSERGTYIPVSARFRSPSRLSIRQDMDKAVNGFLCRRLGRRCKV